MKNNILMSLSLAVLLMGCTNEQSETSNKQEEIQAEGTGIIESEAEVNENPLEQFRLDQPTTENTIPNNPTPENVANYGNFIFNNYSPDDYDASKLREVYESDETNNDIEVSDETLQLEMMGYDLFSDMAEYFGLTYEEASNLYIEGNNINK